MTKRHFIALADVLRNFNSSNRLNNNAPFNPMHIETLATFCQKQNPRFNRKRWIAYVNGECGPNGGAR